MLDILFLNVPLMNLGYPAAGTALLSGICRHHGYTSKVIDLNYTLYQQHGQDFYNEVASYLTLSGEIDSKIRYLYQEFLREQIVIIREHNPCYLGISVFTFECQKFTQDICKALREDGFNSPIVLGGAGLSTTGIANKIADFGVHMINQGLADFYIRGEGDQAILTLLETGDLEDCSKVHQIKNIENVPLSDYQNVINNQYLYPNNTLTLPVNGSRGCVRECSFCDIHKFWPKFHFRPGIAVANEMIQLHQETGCRNFIFTDSLINGSLKSFRDMCHTLVAHYRRNNLPDAYLTWGGQFICRDSHSFKDRDFELAAQAGMTGVAIGVETGSDMVRTHMKKGFTNADLDFTMASLSRHRINCYFLMIIGYPTETWEDFMETVRMFERYERYCKDGTIIGVNLGGTLSLDAGTDLVENAQSLGIHDLSSNHSDVFGINWINEHNPTLTLEERIARRILLQERLMELNYSIWNGDHQIKRIMAAYTKIKNGQY